MNTASDTPAIVKIADIIAKRHFASFVLNWFQHDLVDALAKRHPDGKDAAGSFMLPGTEIDLTNGETTLKISDNGIITSEAKDIVLYGLHLKCFLGMYKGNKRLNRIANDCIACKISTFDELALRIERRISNTIYIPLLVLIATLIAILIWNNTAS